MDSNLKWTAYSNKSRIEIIEHIKDIIASNDGYIMNFSMYSDLAITLSIEISENKICDLHKELSTILSISEFILASNYRATKKEKLILLNISFGKGKGDLRSQIPEIPG